MKTNAYNMEELEDLKEQYFFGIDQKISLNKGDYLMYRGELNDRLYLVTSGQLAGLFRDENNEHIEQFFASEGMFLGVYSFFSSGKPVYSSVIAKTDCELRYVEGPDTQVNEHKLLKEVLMPILVNELSTRQKQSHQLSLERQVTLKKLIQTEKMATLGQMASGLAHELNNAVGVMKSKSEWLAGILLTVFEKNFRQYVGYYTEGLSKGEFLSTSNIRKRSKELEKTYKIDHNLARRLARTGIDLSIIKKRKIPTDYLDQVFFFWDLGSSLKDIGIAAKQSTHVLQSIKQLGRNSSHRDIIEDVNETIHEALAIMKSLTKGIDIELKFEKIPPFRASRGEMEQVWINLIKNSSEALQTPGTAKPMITISTFAKNKNMYVKIEDNGPGISIEDQEKIFQPNFTTKKEGLSFGLGLGLSIVQRIVESYQGTITLTSEPGHTKFEILIPIK